MQALALKKDEKNIPKKTASGAGGSKLEQKVIM